MSTEFQPNQDESLLKSQLLITSNPTIEDVENQPIREVDHQTLSSMMEQELGSTRLEDRPFLKLITEESSPGKTPYKQPFPLVDNNHFPMPH